MRADCVSSLALTKIFGVSSGASFFIVFVTIIIPSLEYYALYLGVIGAFIGLTPKILGDASGLRVIACINKPDTANAPPINNPAIVHYVTGHTDTKATFLLHNVRVPRMIAGLFIGGALAGHKYNEKRCTRTDTENFR
jgi:ABC-type Fe3+-siderophore transport system permease subunit